jgi:hypothetical protein
MSTFEIKLSAAQYALFRDALKEAEGLGDCRVLFRFSTPRVEFVDYEGVQHTLKLLIAVRTMTAADIRSWESVKRKIDDGVRSAA